MISVRLAHMKWLIPLLYLCISGLVVTRRGWALWIVQVKVAYYATSIARFFSWIILKIMLVSENYATFSYIVLFK